VTKPAADLQPKPIEARIKDMIKRRTLLSLVPFALIAACERAQAGQSVSTSVQPDMANMPTTSLADLTGGAGKVVWLSLIGTVRLSTGNANVRPARLFDIWQIEGGAALVGASITRLDGGSASGTNDAGATSIWLNRAFTHAALTTPIEQSRLSKTSARVIAIDATQIWLVEGGLGAAPALTGAALSAFNAWQTA
jgi:hypothetical protein